MLKKTVLGAAIIAIALGMSACGSSTTVKQVDTQGQQLMDLKEAYDAGVVTEKEYNKTKAQILKGK